MRYLIPLLFILISCTSTRSVMVIETDGTKYVRVQAMNRIESYIVKVKGASEGQIIEIKVKQLKRTK